jgi:hypothetical protein
MEIKVMEKVLFQVKLLPNKYKKFGVATLMAGLPLAFGIIFILLELKIITNARSFFDTWSNAVLYYPIIIGLALLNFSEEKQEDEMVQNLRYKAFMNGVFYLVVALLWLPFYTNIAAMIIGKSMGMPDMGGMLGALALLLVYTYVSFKYNLLRTRKALETDEE